MQRTRRPARDQECTKGNRGQPLALGKRWSKKRAKNIAPGDAKKRKKKKCKKKQRLVGGGLKKPNHAARGPWYNCLKRASNGKGGAGAREGYLKARVKK